MALTNICILKYNNYYNRIIKVAGDTLSDYYDSQTTYGECFENINFCKADGVSASLVLNTAKTGCDYLLEYDALNNIITRWFIISCDNLRNGQQNFTLHRDTVADWKNDVLNAPTYIEKGMIQNGQDYAIYNTEQASFNQIKQSEALLKDKSDVAWVVGYVDTKNIFDSEEGQSPTEKVISVGELGFETVGTYSTEAAFYEAIGYSTTNFWQSEPKYEMTVKFDMGVSAVLAHKEGTIKLYDTTGTVETKLTSLPRWALRADSKSDQQAINEAALYTTTAKDTIEGYLRNYLPNYHSTALSYYNRKYVTIGDKNYFIKVTKEKDSKQGNMQTSDTAYTSLQALYEAHWPQDTDPHFFYHTPAINYADPVWYKITYNEYKLALEEVSGTLSCTWKNDCRRLNDAPYKLFAIPFGKVQVDVGQEFFTIADTNEILNIASTIKTQLGEHVYDIQLLPYCPCQEYIESTGCIDLSTKIENKDYFIMKENNTPKEIIIFSTTSRGTFDITYDIPVAASIIDKKVQLQTDLWRICSPNYASQFDFNVVKTGDVSKFNIDYTYKPINPYIHINPNWKELYGDDYDDCRGLVIKGDFGLPIVTDAWVSYQNTNKNYAEIFARQTQTLELQNSLGKTGDIIKAITGSTSGAMSGAISGTMMGGHPVAGAIIGGTASLAGGIADVVINEKLRKDAMDLRSTLFKYGNDNIKAQPEALSRISSYDYNNKIFPVLEYYSCSEQEKSWFQDQLVYDGMTINRVGNIKDFIDEDNLSFIKGSIIRLPDIAESYQVTKTISDEINEGVYM